MAMQGFCKPQSRVQVSGVAPISPLTKRESMVECSRSLDFAGWRRGHLVTLITWRSSVRIRYPLSFPLTIGESVVDCRCSLNIALNATVDRHRTFNPTWWGCNYLWAHHFYFWVKSKVILYNRLWGNAECNWNCTLLISFVLLQF